MIKIWILSGRLLRSLALLGAPTVVMVLLVLLFVQDAVPAYSQNSGAPATATALTAMRKSIFATQTAAASFSNDLDNTTLTSTPVSRQETTVTERPATTATQTPTPAKATLRPTATQRPKATQRPTATPQESRGAAPPMVEVLVQSLNLRSGPGLGYAVISNAELGQQLPVLGQWGNCAWLKVQPPDSGAAWTSGAKAYTQLNTSCSAVPRAAAPQTAPVEQSAQTPEGGTGDSDTGAADPGDDQVTGALPAPAPLSPPDGIMFDHYPRTTTLVWKAVPGAATYTVEVDCYHCSAANRWSTEVGVTFFLAPDITDTSFTFDYVGAQPGRWRVHAVDAAGRAGERSAWQVFTYTQ